MTLALVDVLGLDLSREVLSSALRTECLLTLLLYGLIVADAAVDLFSQPTPVLLTHRRFGWKIKAQKVIPLPTSS